jgi:PelA/Pel-15E family pectate lyase
MKKNYSVFLVISIMICCFLSFSGCSSYNDDPLSRQVKKTMQKATQYFQREVTTNGGYLWNYKSDFTMRQGEEIASSTTIWIQPPGTPAVGMAYLEAFNTTGDTLFLNGAISAAHALAWGQLASGGWDYRIDFDSVESKRWYYRRDLERGDTLTNRKRRNVSTLDDNTTQSALQLLMQIDKTLDFKDAEIHHSAIYGLDALLKVQYPNGAWPQRFRVPPDPDKFPVKKAQYPVKWSREYTGIPYDTYYTFNDNTISDVVTTMIEAYKTYSDERFLNAAKHCGDFIILAQMPEPQPAWAQQYNAEMEPAWARKFEPPAITGSESFSVMRTLLYLYLETGEQRFLDPVPRALKWAESSLLPDKRLARFYELQTNRPLYFNAPRQYSNLPEPAFPALKDYTLIYEDTDLPNHYSFKVPGTPIEMVKSYYNRILEKGRDTILAEQNRIKKIDPDKIREIINSLDEKGRWLEKGRLKTNDARNPYVEAEILSTETFVSNLSQLSTFLKSRK